MSSERVTTRPTDAELRADRPDGADEGFPPELANLPWIDVHNHAQTLSWEDRERYSLSGCRAMVMVAAGYHWTPYRPVRPEDVRYLWDDAVGRLQPIDRGHLFEPKLAVGVHTGVRVEEYDRLLDRLPEYCALEAVAAVGETGITPSQHAVRWELDQQREVVREQMAIADERDLPVIVHTPGVSGDDGASAQYGFEKDRALGGKPVLTGPEPALEAVEIDLELMDEVGLADERVVLSHADEYFAPTVADRTDCYLSYTIRHPRSEIDAVAEAIEQYGAERILLETDAAGVLRSDPVAIKRSVVELYARGIDVEAIRKVVLENQLEILDL